MAIKRESTVLSDMSISVADVFWAEKAVRIATYRTPEYSGNCIVGAKIGKKVFTVQKDLQRSKSVAFVNRNKV